MRHGMVEGRRASGRDEVGAVHIKSCVVLNIWSGSSIVVAVVVVVVVFMWSEKAFGGVAGVFYAPPVDS